MLAFNPSVWLSNYHLGIRIVQDRKNIFSVFFSGLQEAKITVYFPLHTCMQCIEKSCDNNSEQKERESERKKKARENCVVEGPFSVSVSHRKCSTRQVAFRRTPISLGCLARSF